MRNSYLAHELNKDRPIFFCSSSDKLKNLGAQMRNSYCVSIHDGWGDVL